MVWVRSTEGATSAHVLLVGATGAAGMGPLCCVRPLGRREPDVLAGLESPIAMRRSGITIAAVLVLASVVLIVSAATNRLPSLTGGCESLASSVAAWVSSSLMPPPPSATPSADSGATFRHQAAPLSSSQLGAPLVHGTFISACGAPDDMKIVVNIAVKMGRAVSVSVTTQPPSPSVAACVERSAGGLRWDVSPKTDHVTVTY